MVLFGNFIQLPPLSAAPHPPRVVQDGPKKVLRVVACVLKGVEKLTFFNRIRTWEPHKMEKKKIYL